MARPHTMRRTGAATALAAAALLAAAACGSSTSGSTAKLAPADAVRTGVDGLGNSNAATLTLKLDATKQQLQALAKASGDSASSDATTESVLAGGTITLALKAAGASFRADQAKAGSNGKESFALDVNAGDAANLLQLDVINQVLYARADAQKLANYGGDQGRSALTQFSSGSVGKKYPFVSKAVAGGWLKFDLSDLLQFAKGVSPSSVPMVDPSQVQALAGSLGRIYDKDVQVTRAGSDSVLGDHLVLTGNTQTVGADLVAALKSSFGALPGASRLFAHADTSSLPAKDVRIDAYVAGGSLDAVKLNLTQFFDAATARAVYGQPIYVEADIARTADIKAPSDATTVSTGQLLGFFGAFAQSGSSGSSGSGSSGSY